MRSTVALASAVALTLFTLGCASSDGTGGATTGTDGGTTTTASDSGSGTPVADAGSTAPSTDAGAPAPTTDAGTATAGATLTGSVKRQAATAPSAGGKGPIYVAVFDSDPVVNRQNARAVGNALIADADMTSATASVRYTITGLPPRSQPYYVIAFLDDNKNATSAAPAPDRGDLVSMNGFSAPTVTLATATSVTLDLTLSMAMPF